MQRCNIQILVIFWVSPILITVSHLDDLPQPPDPGLLDLERRRLEHDAAVTRHRLPARPHRELALVSLDVLSHSQFRGLYKKHNSY